MLDVLIKNGRVIDGTGNPWYRANVGIRGDRIAYIGTLEPEARQVVDAAGCAVTPGFWDVHTHSEFQLLIEPDMLGYTFQGITTVVSGNCSFGIYPDKRHKAQEFTPSEAGQYRDLEWSSLEGYAAPVNRKGTSVNSIPLIGHGTIRWTVMGNEQRAPRPDELKKMEDLLREGMRQGAAGMSTGLDYVPSRFAEIEELVALGGVLRETGGIYASHTRWVSPLYAYSYNANEVLCPTEDRARHIEGIREAIEIGRRAEIPVQISHLHTSAVIGTEMAMIHQARREGVDVTVDAMSYNVPFSTLSDTLLTLTKTRSPEYADVPWEEYCAMLRRPEVRERMSRSPQYRRYFWPETAPRWRLAQTGDPAMDGRSVGEVAKERGMSPVDLMFDLVLDRSRRILIVPPEEVLVELPREQITDDLIMMGSDHLQGDPKDPYARTSPRGFAAVPRYLEHAQRFGQSLETTVRQLSSLPAARFGFPERGTIAPHQIADALVFRPEEVRGRATMADPLQLAEGMRYVFIAGQPVIAAGKHTDRRPGRVLLRMV
ncbi:MAG: amidohydrolase family protein [Armatimonadetes bacterium]|nr:amidohydrolase family protein [Armatimonadota bacterium]